MVSQLPVFTIMPGKMDEFVHAWRAGVVRLRFSSPSSCCAKELSDVSRPDARARPRVQDVMAAAERLAPELEALSRRIHAHPEVGFLALRRRVSPMPGGARR